MGEAATGQQTLFHLLSLDLPSGKMGCCELSDKKLLVIFLIVAQLLMIALFGKLYVDFQLIPKHVFKPFRTKGTLKLETSTRDLASSATKVPETSSLYAILKNNSVYRHLQILETGKREFANLLLIVSSAPKRLDRRNTIRETWWPLCKDTNRVCNDTYN